MQPLLNCIGPTIRIGQEILCLPYAGFFFFMNSLFAYRKTEKLKVAFGCKKCGEVGVHFQQYCSPSEVSLFQPEWPPRQSPQFACSSIPAWRSTAAGGPRFQDSSEKYVQKCRWFQCQDIYKSAVISSVKIFTEVL